MSEPGEHHEVLIVKRGGGGRHDDHHGGVWKIAFADFMTAMMAFFLVMWLISANDKTKAVIAKYFNPMELVDSTPSPRGLNNSKKDDPSVERKESSTPDPKMKDAKDAKDGKDGKQEKQSPENAPSRDHAPATGHAPPAEAHPAEGEQTHMLDAAKLDDAEQTPRHQEMDLIRDPYAVLAEIADKKSVELPRQSVASAGSRSGGTGAVGLKAGEAYRDPFEPQAVPPGANPIAAAAPVQPVEVPPRPMPAPQPTPSAAAAAPQPPGTETHPAEAAMQPAGTVTSLPGAAAATPAAAAAPAAPAPSAGAEKPAPAERPPADRTDDKAVTPAVLRTRIAGLVRPGEPAAPRLEVRRTDEGTLISLTDSADFSMFASASARPSPQTIALMARIGKLLKTQKGSITLRGFTDSRPFRSDTYDNWRLSTERAHIAQYMLVRGGLDEARIDRVEGYADRRPKTPKDPEAAENRRIEILVRDAAP